MLKRRTFIEAGSISRCRRRVKKKKGMETMLHYEEIKKDRKKRLETGPKR